MATQIQPVFDHSRKRQRLTQFPKLLPNEKVEVRSIEEGFQGSWHSGIVIESRTRIRVVKYDHLVCDDSSNNLIESIPVSFSADCKIPADWGSKSEFPDYRGKIRPIPPRLIQKEVSLRYGHCVDVFYKDAWWEGVVFERLDERVFLVFFPDMGDELRVPFESLRRTQDWDSVNDEWDLRKDWVFLEVIEELKREWPVLVSVKQIWYDVRMTRCFVNEMKEWTFPVKERWKETVKEVIVESLKLTMAEFFQRLTFSEDFHDGCLFSDVKRRVLDSVMNLEPSFFGNLGDLRSDLVVKSDHENLHSDLVVKSDHENLHSDLVVKSDHENLENPVFEWRDVFPEPECCPDAISKYFERSKYGGKPSVDLTLKVRQHLSYLGWKIESKVYRIGSNGGATSRYRYTDPNGTQYYSLNVLCTELNKRHNSSSSFNVNRYLETPLLSPTPAKEEQEPKTHVMESEFCPQAVVDYCSMTSGWNSDLPKSRDGWVKTLQSNAMKHLFAVGWSKFYFERVSGRKVIVYASPNGRKFYSLRGACNHYLKDWLCSGLDNISELAETREINAYRDLIKKKGTVLCIKPISSSKKQSVKKLESLTKSRNGPTHDSLRNAHVLRSSKQVRKEISPMYRTPRTVLSWLIDNNIVLPRAKVQYRCKKDGRTMKEGRVTRDGIKCRCCKRTFSVTGFRSHAGRTAGRRPSANVFLEDGRSLLDCQRQLQENLDQDSRSINRHEIENENDYICSICQYGGELVLCDECPSSFHTSCLGLKVEVPEGEWFCPSCCCGICNRNRFDENYEQNTDSDVLNCAQCERRYHIGCLKGSEGFLKPETYLEANWFCSLRCEEVRVEVFDIIFSLHGLLGKSIPVGRDNLTWTLLKHKKLESSDYDDSDAEELTENNSKLNVAISVMHECFEPVKEPRTGRDITEDVILCRWSELRRLNFKGFYTVLLEKDDELISTAVVRVYGEKVAELPLVGTRFQYRRRGMCHILMHELEKKLKELGVERLVLPAVSSVLNTWTQSFGFSLMTESEKSKFLGCTFLDFQGTTMCHKLLATDLPSTEPVISRGNSCGTIVDLDRIGAISEVLQEGRIHESGEVGKSPLEHNDNANPLQILMNQPTNVEQQSKTECSVEASNPKEGNTNGFLKCYHRRKYMPTRVEAFLHM
ncbi:hypothetical protein OSB04_023378 [Centaurea solstitialis]|uniref:PHD finger transcription factor n=1 Tax=Centaurea solstitialis TaxID=347529 RepID=A0AA38SVV2_9ASTR|nr:hypothetical protein OSB04_023378 [Centaurea solstitialis]